MEKQRVVVIGGGIIGLSSAYYMQKAGFDVTVVDKGRFGEGCSNGNLGGVYPDQFGPLPSPQVLRSSLGLMFKRDSALYIKPTSIPRLSGWLFRFLANSTTKRHGRTERALMELGVTANAEYDQLSADGVKFETYEKGLLYVYLKQSSFENQIADFKRRELLYGIQAPVVLSKNEVLTLEPALSGEVVGGISLHNGRLVRPESVCAGLVDWLRDAGAQLRENTEVLRVRQSAGRAHAVETSDGILEADIFIFATGAWTPAITKMIRYSPPIQAGKGYSVTIVKPSVQLHNPLTLADMKTVLSPYKDAVRVGGTMELSGLNTKIVKKRIDLIHSALDRYFPDGIGGESVEEWVGMRPMTPDDLPVIGKVPNSENVYISSGHGMNGVATAPVSGRILSELIMSGKSQLSTSAFDPKRFA